jgi:photosystem II stability/assembly factor-like uncharacterized protein
VTLELRREFYRDRARRTLHYCELEYSARTVGALNLKPIVLALLIAAVGCSRTDPMPPTAGGPTAAAWMAGPNVGQLDLLGVMFVDERNGWAVGDIAPTGEGGAIYQTNDGGRNWRATARTTEILTAVFFVNLNRGWAAGHAGRIQRTDDGGATWRTQRVEREGEVLNSIYFVDERRGWVVGGNGLLLLTADGGDSWELIDTGRREDLWAVRFATLEKGWAVGEDGLILSTSDGGRTWVQRASGTTRALLGLAVAASGSVVAVGAGGTILRTDDGETWSAVQSGTTATLNAVAAAAPEVFWTAGSGGALLGSTDAGRSWQMTAQVTSQVAPAPASSSSGTPNQGIDTSKSDLIAIDLRSSLHGVAVGQRGATRLLQQK